jgi:protein SCO1/2
MPAFDGATPSATIAAFADQVRARPALREELLPLLREQSPVYAGRSANDAERLRGYLLASFESTGLPPEALACVLEELETGMHPYAVAAAARALRGAHSVPPRTVPLLLAAIDRIRLSDDFVCFDGWDACPGDGSTTALMELLRTIAWLGPRTTEANAALIDIAGSAAAFSPAVHDEIAKAVAATTATAPAHCCCVEKQATPGVTPQRDALLPPPDDDVATLELEDQDGARLTFADFFVGRPSVITFFYTRCMNPNKCSLNITKLGRLQRRLETEDMQQRVNVAAVTYDPAFDLPQRLRAYGADRGVSFDRHNRILRTTGGFERLQRRFDLGVGYGGATVNRHRSELFILDGAGRTHLAVTRTLWDEDEVVYELRGALANS